MREAAVHHWRLPVLLILAVFTLHPPTHAATIVYDQCVALMSWPAAATALQLQECTKPVTTCTTCRGMKTDQLGNVVEVDLHAAILNGTLPPSWTALSSLRSLNLSSAAVKGPLPSQWKALTALSKLDLSNNSIDGTLPEEWKALTALVDLNLSFNKMNGSFPIVWSALTRLTQLWLSANAFTGPLPGEWSAFTRLQGIYLCGNAVLGGSLPPSWSNLVSLNVMLAHSNSLTGPIPASWASSLSNLSLIQLDKNRITGPIPAAWFSSKPRLTWFSIASNRLKGPIPAITNSPLLEVLDVQNNSLSGTIPPLTASNLPKLSALRIGRNNFSGPIPSLPPSLVYFDARNNMFTGNISALPTTLKYLNVDSNRLTQVESLYAPNITFVSLAANNFTHRLPRPLSPSIQMVNVSYNSFSGPIPPSWADTQCAVMDISHNNLQGPIAANLTAAVLVASYNSLSGTLPAVWPSMPPIQVLDLQNNSIGGKLPAKWLQQDVMQRLRFLGLANNKVSGSIPVQWVEAGGANKTKLVLGDSVWDKMVQHKMSSWLSTTNSKWLKAVCTNPTLFERLGNMADNEAVNGLADAVQQDIENVAVDAATSLDAVKEDNVRLIAIVGQMYKEWGSVPVDAYFMALSNRTDKLDRDEICSNGRNALPVVLVLWGVVVVFVLVCLMIYAYLRPFVQNIPDAKSLNVLVRWIFLLHARCQTQQNQVMVRLVHMGCILVYWGDIITDVLVLVSVWGANWPSITLFIIIVAHYLFSATVLSYRYTEHKGRSCFFSVLFFPFTLISIPFLDTFAFAHEAGLPLNWLSTMLGTSIDFERYHEGRALIETFMESVPCCILQSVIFILGNNPSRPLFVDGRIFLLSILFSGVRTVVTAVTVLWQALFNSQGLIAYCVGLVSGHEVFTLPGNVQKPHTQGGTGINGTSRGPVETMKPSKPPVTRRPTGRVSLTHLQGLNGPSSAPPAADAPRTILTSPYIVDVHTQPDTVPNESVQVATGGQWPAQSASMGHGPAQSASMTNGPAQSATLHMSGGVAAAHTTPHPTYTHMPTSSSHASMSSLPILPSHDSHTVSNAMTSSLQRGVPVDMPRYMSNGLQDL